MYRSRTAAAAAAAAFFLFLYGWNIPSSSLALFRLSPFARLPLFFYTFFLLASALFVCVIDPRKGAGVEGGLPMGGGAIVVGAREQLPVNNYPARAARTGR